MDPREKEMTKKAINKNHAENSQDQDAPHQVQETTSSAENEYFPANEDENSSGTNTSTINRESLKKTLEMDDDQLEDQEDDNIY